ncbi:helix-turn-helix domain-containing protein [Streptomyces aurantiacus]|uniref:DNA-binding protein n=1 Tax=Streptomyces aurantiacus TaxID=47760 RepID=A0A7G1P6I1_9ACTN|nr:helix-turn-helix domain-containing protein [Streptomyces aurantiacus]BCL29440.1 DNA-binding protein [Streptomyces aurantiacus]
MDTQNTSVRPRAQARTAGKNRPPRSARTNTHPGSGITHDNSRHTTRFTVIGNHLAQHPALSGLAIGLAVHIQSLPSGARADIRTLAARFPEGPTRIAAALRELEAHGYLCRTRVRTESGRIVTHTVSRNQPGRHGDATDDVPEPPAESPAGPAAPPPAEPPARQEAQPLPHPNSPPEPHPQARPHPQPQPPKKKPPRRALPAVPQPAYTSPDLLRTAVDVLARLRREDPRLLLSATDAEHLAPGVAAWLERDLTPTDVREVLAHDLPPEPLRRPAAFLAHRLTAKLPPLPRYRAPAAPPTVRHPHRNCDGCDRSFRSPHPGARCRDCRSGPPEFTATPTP